MRLIDAEDLKKELLSRDFFPALVKHAIEKSPTIDAVEVVRCRDCEYYCVECMYPGTGWCEYLERGEYDNHFCNYGERKDE